MKKLLLILLIALFSMQIFGCAGGDGSENVEPVYASEYSSNDNYHWRAQTNGTGKTDYAKHENKKGKCICGKYFDSSVALTYEKVVINGVEGLSIAAYNNDIGVEHVEVPAYNTFNGERLPVIQLAASCFAKSSLRSIKLNEGLLYINRSVFNSSMLEEIVIPNSVIGCAPGDVSYKGLYNTFGGCNNLKRAVIGDGIEVVGGYVFSSCVNLSEVILGKNVKELRIRAFYECKELKEIVLPESLVYIQEGEIYTPAVDKILTLNRMFTYASRVYLNITKEEYRALKVPLFERDMVTGEVIPDNIVRNPGYCEGWEGMADIIYKGEWEYDANGKPKVIKTK